MLFYYYEGVYAVARSDATFAAYDKAGVNVFPARIGRRSDGPATAFVVECRPRDRDGWPRADRGSAAGTSTSTTSTTR